MKTVTADQMRELDRRTIEEAGIPGALLMERAGTEATIHILDFFACLNKRHIKRYILLAGKGNNGGDAYVVARVLREKTDKAISIYSVCPIDTLTGDAKAKAELIAERVDFHVKNKLHHSDFQDGDIIIDGLLGTGISGPLREPYKNWIDTVNASKLPVASLDIPSGLDADNGSAKYGAIKASLTLTMGLPKQGLFRTQGVTLTGCIRIIDIGIPQEYIDNAQSNLRVNSATEVQQILDRIPLKSHKNSRGRILVIGGSNLYPGAAVLAAEAALVTGGGVVTLALPESLKTLPCRCSCSLIPRYIADDNKGVFSKCSLDDLKLLIETHDVIIFGPGVSKDPALLPVLELFNSVDKPMLYDADALNLIAQFPKSFSRKTAPTIMTPHPGEASRLAKSLDIEEWSTKSRLQQAQKLAKLTGTTIILKGYRSIIADSNGGVIVNTTGSPALATAGSGDVLSGIAGALLANNKNVFEVASGATFIHGLAAELSDSGQRGLTADKLIKLIPQAMKWISPFA